MTAVTPAPIATSPDESLYNARAYLRHVSLPSLADPIARWAVIHNLMDTAKDLRLAGVGDVLGTMQGALGVRLAELGVADVLADVVASDREGNLVGRVLEAFGAKAGAERAALVVEADASADTNVEDDAPHEPGVLVRVATVQAEAVSWLWHHRLPRRKLVVLDGDPGLGKSTVTLDLGARLSRGQPMPGENENREPEGVVVLSAEDGISDTIRPRLEAAGADLDRVAVLTAARDKEGRPRLPSLPGDLEAVRWAIRQMRAGLLIVDPLMAYLSGRIDAHRDQDVRGALAQLAELADDTGVVVVIVRHLNKTQGGHPIYRGGGSIGIIGAARAGLLVAKDPQDESRRILAVSKSNLGPIPPALAYRLVPVGDTSAVSWEGETEHRASELLAEAASNGESRGAREQAEEFLREILVTPRLSEDVKREATDAGISWATVRRAKDRLGVRATKQGSWRGGDPRWYWELARPEGAHKSLKVLTPEVEHLQGNVSIFKPEAPEAQNGQPPRVGDVLDDGRRVLELDAHGPVVVSKAKAAPEAFDLEVIS